MLNELLAGAQRWVGEEELAEGLIREARGSFGRSLWYRPWQPRILTLWSLCWLPGWAYRSLRELRQRIRQQPVSQKDVAPVPDLTGTGKK
jgi:hypothetical protein